MEVEVRVGEGGDVKEGEGKQLGGGTDEQVVNLVVQVYLSGFDNEEFTIVLIESCTPQVFT